MDAVTFLRALAFASVKHSRQRRKDADASPYINHPIAVAMVLADEGRVTNETLLVAAVLHDTIEDTETTANELRAAFGEEVTALVVELTDNKSLPKDERKRLQIVHAPYASSNAKQLKIADKICNLRDITNNPPKGWPAERKREYLSWATAVVDGCRGVNSSLDEAFDQTTAAARPILATA